MVFFQIKVLLPFEYHDFRLMTMILQEWLSVRCILFNSYNELTEHYEVREEALVQKKHKPGESRNSIRVAFCFTQRSTKVKTVVQQPIRVRDLLAKFHTSPVYVLLFSQTDQSAFINLIVVTTKFFLSLCSNGNVSR
jgi:hypothetical protein